MKIKDLWEEFIVYVKNPETGKNISLCGLCANEGIVDTTSVAKRWNTSAGIKGFCICPNGRAMKKSNK